MGSMFVCKVAQREIARLERQVWVAQDPMTKIAKAMVHVHISAIVLKQALQDAEAVELVEHGDDE